MLKLPDNSADVIAEAERGLPSSVKMIVDAADKQLAKGTETLSARMTFSLTLTYINFQNVVTCMWGEMLIDRLEEEYRENKKRNEEPIKTTGPDNMTTGDIVSHFRDCFQTIRLVMKETQEGGSFCQLPLEDRLEILVDQGIKACQHMKSVLDEYKLAVAMTR